MNDMPWQAKLALAGFVFSLMGGAMIGSYVTNDSANRSIIIGAIIASFSGVVGYYFGSSDSSQKKDATIASQGAALAVSVPSSAVEPVPSVVHRPTSEPARS